MAMDVKTFVLQTLLTFATVDRNDAAAARDRTTEPKLACVGLEKQNAKQHAACSYTTPDGTEVTVIVMVHRPHRAHLDSKPQSK
jgi:hypothetical protein